MNQHYGVLRVVRMLPGSRSPAGVADMQGRYPSGWLPEEGLVHVLTRRDTMIGRALNNDIILLDLTVSREHARLLLDQSGWRIINLTEQNVVRVNGRPVPRGGSLPVHPQDILVLGSTMLQLIAPQNHRELLIAEEETRLLEMTPNLVKGNPGTASRQTDHQPAIQEKQLSSGSIPRIPRDLSAFRRA